MMWDMDWSQYKRKAKLSSVKVAPEPKTLQQKAIQNLELLESEDNLKVTAAQAAWGQ